ncbi:MAG TPA: hypothetical protein PKN89_01590 [Anaerolineaceae bacterium]|nr:hypothetical protein [Anaerolineaceae bacterium]
MKRLPALIVGTLSGLVVLAAMFLMPRGGAVLEAVLRWVIILAAVALLVAVASLVLTHLRFIVAGRKGFLLSLVLVGSFTATLIFGFLRGVDDPLFLKWVGAIVRPIETALLGLVALVMMSAAMKIFRERGWSALTVSFGASAVVFLILGLGFFQNLKIPVINEVIRFVEGLPMIGARGLLIGIGIGLLMMAFRVLFGMEGSGDD